jgi:ubiquinone/menaquinone biosynthesis C-methylase UbiE
MRLTAQAHARLSAHLRPGDWALDATAGNGHDTLFLARQVAPGGQVWAWDTQSAALKATRARLQAAGLEAVVTLIEASHHHLRERTPANAAGRVMAVTFNLGYRPGGDPQHITRAGTTMPALEAACRLLHPDGMISLLSYRGHPGGETEYQALREWLATAPLAVERITRPGANERAPVLFLLTRRG